MKRDLFGCGYELDLLLKIISMHTVFILEFHKVKVKLFLCLTYEGADKSLVL
jgi:hypothetical protein